MFIVSALLLGLIYAFVPGNDKKYLWSMASAYTSIILLGVTLILGPPNVLNKRNNPISSDLRRDIGIWYGVTGIVHLGNIWLYFIKAVEGEESYQLRGDLFGAANYSGLIAGFILLALVAFIFQIKGDLSISRKILNQVK